jgi:S-adenosyl methyltransferase
MTEEYAPPGVDVNKPSIARAYDYFLGGKDNFEIDRQVVEATSKVMPPGWDSAEGALDNRAFLRRAVTLLAQSGIRQFLDIGSGLPTQGNVHEVAHEIDPRTKVVYVDNDPIVLAHARALLAADHTAVITADLREPEAILGDATVREFIDFSQPVGLLMFAILHHVHDDEDPYALTARYREVLASGSYLALSHFMNPGAELPRDAERAANVEAVFNEHLGTGRWRTKEEIASFFGDFEILEPGVVSANLWRPDPADPRATDGFFTHLLAAGVGRKP